MNLENKYFTIKNGILLKFKDKKADRVRIPEGVVSIGEKAFFTSFIRDIQFPDTLISIEKQAFWGCHCLENLVIPDSVKTIGNDAFAECRGIEKLILGLGVEKIGARAFYQCNNIFCDISGENVKSIGDCAFCWCKYVNSFYFPNCTQIADNTFNSCFNVKSITLGNIERIGNHTFAFCMNLENFTVLDSVQQICRDAFCYCDNLTIRVPKNLDNIGTDAFYNCKEVIYI